MKPIIRTFNTGRLYTSAGQRIAYCVLSTGNVAMCDRDRYIDYVLACEPNDRAVLDAYDNHAYPPFNADERREAYELRHVLYEAALAAPSLAAALEPCSAPHSMMRAGEKCPCGFVAAPLEEDVAPPATRAPGGRVKFERPMIRKTTRVRRGLKRALGTLEGLVAELADRDIARDQFQMTRAEVEELKLAVDWIRQQARDPREVKP